MKNIGKSAAAGGLAMLVGCSDIEVNEDALLAAVSLGLVQQSNDPFVKGTVGTVANQYLQENAAREGRSDVSITINNGSNVTDNEDYINRPRERTFTCRDWGYANKQESLATPEHISRYYRGLDEKDNQVFKQGEDFFPGVIFYRPFRAHMGMTITNRATAEEVHAEWYNIHFDGLWFTSMIGPNGNTWSPGIYDIQYVVDDNVAFSDTITVVDNNSNTPSK